MSNRLVSPAPSPAAAAKLGDSTTAPPNGDDYKTRIAKYIPGEVLAAYLAAMAIVATMSGEAAVITGWVVFAVGLIMTPAYLFYLSKGEKCQWGVHATISSIAFIVWAYAMGDPFKAPIYNPQISSLLLIAFTLVSGLFMPKSKT